MCNRNNVAAETDRRRCDCECVFRCLLELIKDALGENDHHCCRNNNNVAGAEGRRRRECECVFKCLEKLLEDALEEENNHHCCRK